MRGTIPLLFVSALVLTACQRTASRPDLVKPNRPVKVLDPAVKSDSLNAFGLKFLREVANEHPGSSFAASPFGAYCTLAIFANASEGRTLKSVAQAMEIKDIRIGELNDSIMSLQDDIYRGSETPFVSRNAIFMVWPIMLSRDFKQEMSDSFRFDITRLGSAGLGAMNQMNDWAAQDNQAPMRGMISNVDKNTVFLAANSVSFGGSWLEAFDPNLTKEQTFHAGSTSVPVMMMQRTGKIRAFESESIWAVTLPCQGSDINVTFIIPKSDAMTVLYKGLNPQDWKSLMDKSWPQKLTIQIPRFNITTDLDLRESSSQLSTDFLFDAETDMRYMSVEMQGKYALGQWHQRMAAKFDERGGSPEPYEKTGEEKTVIFDRPFLWIVSDEKTDSILAGGVFAGQDSPK